MKLIVEDFRIRGARFEASPTAITTTAGLRLLVEVGPAAQAIRRQVKIKKSPSGFRKEEFLFSLVCNLAPALVI